MPEEEMTDFQFLTTGKYGGVGALIRKKGDGVVVAQPYKGFPADRAGLQIGDRFVEIAGKDARGMTTEQVSALLKGTPNTNVTIKVEKLLTGQVEEVKLRRERIAISGVGYAGFVADSIGYIQHRDFTEGCYEDMRAALEGLQKQGLKALVLDYRNNGGGILQEAVKIVSMFVPKGTEVVTTKGRTEHTVYRTQLEPVAPTLPTERAKDESEMVQQMVHAMDSASQTMERALQNATGDLKTAIDSSRAPIVAFNKTVDSFNGGVRDFSEFNYNLRGTVERLDVTVRDLVSGLREVSRILEKGGKQ